MKTPAFFLFVLLSCRIMAAEVSEEARQAYEWFSTLGFPEVKGAKWAEVTQTYDSFMGDETGTHKLHGFLITETDKDFFILLPDLTVKTMPKGVSKTPFQIRGTFEERPFPAWAAEQLKTLQNPPKDGFRRFGDYLGNKAQAFAFSYFCWRRGEADLAAKFYTEAQKLNAHREKPPASMLEALEIELGHAAMWDAVLRMGGGSLSGSSWGSGGNLEPREKVLEAFRRIIRLFPRCEHIERAKATITTLERMVAEDAKHPPLTQPQLDALPPEPRIAELIWRLRDQNGHQMSQPGSCDIFDYDPKNNTPAHQLLEIGYPAAPALIEALTDDRFSRSVGFGRNFFFSHTILTIGDCAQQILNRMTGQDFYSAGSTSGYMSNEDKMRTVQTSARAWWADYQKKGLKQMLVDSLSEGKTSPNALVEQLKKTDASAVETAVLAGAAKTQNDWLLRQFIDQIASLKTPTATEALVKLMKKHSSAEVRLGAAARLLNLNHPDALPTVLYEWTTHTPPSPGRYDDAFEAMIDILASSGSDRAIQALASRWEACSTSQRLQIIEAISTRMRPKPESFSFRSEVKPHPPSPEALTRVIELLVHALEDTQARYGTSGGRGDYEYSDPRICDHALWALHELEAAKYSFSPKAGRRQRDTERIAAANQWRKEHAQPLLPLPPPPGPKLPPTEALRIVRVILEPSPKPESDETTNKARALEGSHFSPKTIPELLVWFAQSNLPDVQGLDIEASRENDLTGVELRLRIHPGKPKTEDSPDWQTSVGGRGGEKWVGSSSGSCSHSYVVKVDYWEDFQEEVGEVLKQPPETEFTLHAGLRRE
ncbi:MAG: hypothetical protein IPK22_28580 [Verrucomicrobiaceae bacterium]|nr:hypothetical protein [Verrucomicrobiaceae bacterium]